MNNARVRGQGRQLRKLLRYIEEIEPYKYTEEEFEHFHVPSTPWIEWPKTSSKIKTEFCKAWIKKTEEILRAKPEGLEFCKVVCDLTVPYLWDSQIIIFYDKKYYDTFWSRRGSYQDWARITNGRSLIKERNIDTELNEVGFKETLAEEDGPKICYIWFYGEVGA